MVRSRPRDPRKRDWTMINNLLLAVDADTPNEPIKVAGDLAELSGATVLVLHCAEMDTFFDTGTWLDDDTEPRTAVGTAVTQLRERGIKAHGVTARTESRQNTAEAIAHPARFPADILILGLPRLRHVAGVFIGSVAAEVAARTTTPLLLVPSS